MRLLREMQIGNATTTASATRFLYIARCRVTTIPGEAEYCGATKHSNNTCELTALLRAVVDEKRHECRALFDFCVVDWYLCD